MIVLSLIVYTIYIIKSTKRQKKLPLITAIQKVFHFFLRFSSILHQNLQCYLISYASLTWRLISSKTSGLFLKYSSTRSLPCPIFSSL